MAKQERRKGTEARAPASQERPPPGVYFIGAGPGDPELLTLKGRRVLDAADLIIFAGSLVNPALFESLEAAVSLRDSASMHLEEITALMVEAVRRGQVVARVHSGDPGLYGAISEQMAALEEAGVPYTIVPGVSSVFAAAAELRSELTVPELSQTVILTRVGQRTPVPAKEDLASLARHEATLVLYLSITAIEKVAAVLREGYPPSTPVAVVYKASWEDERIIRGTLEDIVEKVREARLKGHALIMVGEVFDPALLRRAGTASSKLYDKTFSHRFRKKAAGPGRGSSRKKE